MRDRQPQRQGPTPSRADSDPRSGPAASPASASHQSAAPALVIAVVHPQPTAGPPPVRPLVPAVAVAVRRRPAPVIRPLTEPAPWMAPIRGGPHAVEGVDRLRPPAPGAALGGRPAAHRSSRG